MTGVRVLVGSRKGAFIPFSDGKREKPDVSGPFFGVGDLSRQGLAGGSESDLCVAIERLVRQQMQHSSDGGQTREAVGNKFVFEGTPGTHKWCDGTPHPWEFNRVWHLEPSLTDPETVLARVEDAALFRTTDGGQTWTELAGLRNHGTGSKWQPGAGGM